MPGVCVPVCECVFVCVWVCECVCKSVNKGTLKHVKVAKNRSHINTHTHTQKLGPSRFMTWPPVSVFVCGCGCVGVCDTHR